MPVGPDFRPLTDRQLMAVMHRLELPEALADALTCIETGGKPPVLNTYDEVTDACRRLARIIDAGRRLPVLVSDLDKAIMVDCVEGSTWASSVPDDLPMQRVGAVRTLEAVAAKMVELGYADSVEVPRS